MIYPTMIRDLDTPLHVYDAYVAASRTPETDKWAQAIHDGISLTSGREARLYKHSLDERIQRQYEAYFGLPDDSIIILGDDDPLHVDDLLLMQSGNRFQISSFTCSGENPCMYARPWPREDTRDSGEIRINEDYIKTRIRIRERNRK